VRPTIAHVAKGFVASHVKFRHQ